MRKCTAAGGNTIGKAGCEKYLGAACGAGMPASRRVMIPRRRLADGPDRNSSPETLPPGYCQLYYLFILPATVPAFS